MNVFFSSARFIDAAEGAVEPEHPARHHAHVPAVLQHMALAQGCDPRALAVGVVATERNKKTSLLSKLLESSNSRLEIETVDMDHPNQVAALRARWASKKFDMLFVNAGVANVDDETIAGVSTEECFFSELLFGAVGDNPWSPHAYHVEPFFCQRTFQFFRK